MPIPVPEFEALCPLDLRDIPHSRDIILPHAWGIKTDSGMYVAPKGLRSDGATVPRLLWRVVDPPFYTMMRPGVVLHDAGYSRCLLFIRDDGKRWIVEDKSEIDTLLMYVGIWNGASEVKARLFHAGVRSFGWIAWEKKRRLQLYENPYSKRFDITMQESRSFNV